MIQIIPAILATSEQEYKDKLQKIKESGAFEGGWIQIDLMDSKFVENKSVGPEVLAKYTSSLKTEAHLMVEYPENWIDELIEAGVDRIIFPIEDAEGVVERIKHITNHSIEVGLSINPETEVAKLEPFLGMIDVALVMSVNPGFGGQEFMAESLGRIKEIREIRDGQGFTFKIEVDGGVDGEVVKQLTDAGVDNLVIGSHLLEGNIDENIEKIWEATAA